MGAEILQSMTYLLQAGALLYNIPLTYNGSILEPGSSTYHTKECREGSALGGGVLRDGKHWRIIQKLAIKCQKACGP